MAVSEIMARKMIEKLPFQDVANHLEAIAKHIEDVSEAQDDLARGIISVYNNQLAIAKHLKITLPKPLVEMEEHKA